jgi:eukaryotic-like serine/threonine-protein kinase
MVAFRLETLPMQTPRVDGLKVLELIGSGGCGRVYLAHDERGAEVALKILDENAVNRRLLEAATLRLELGGWPEGLLPVVSAEFSEVPAIRVTPCALETRPDGSRAPRTLQHHLDAHPGLDSWKLVKSIARPLAAMHRKGVAHGNLKPGNIILDENGGAILTDWALGNMPGTRHLAFTDAVLYQSPEQLKDPAGYDGPEAFRRDVFSFGVIAYRILTGRFPRCHDTFDYVAPPCGETRREGLKADLDRIARNLEGQRDFSWPDEPRNPLETGYREWIDRCLALNPIERPLAMTEVIDGIGSVDRELAASKESGDTALRKRRADKRAWSAVFVTGAMTMVALVFAGLWHLSKTRLHNEKLGAADAVSTHKAAAEAALARQVDAEARMEKARQELGYEREVGLARLEASRLIGDHLFSWAMEKGHRSLPPLDGRELRLKRLERYFEDFLTRTASIESLADERARARLQLSEIALAAGDAPAATKRLGEALKAWENLPMDADLRFRVATNSLLLALLRQSQGDPETGTAFAKARKAFSEVPRAGVDADLLDQRLATLDFHEAKLLAAKGDDTRALEQLMRATQTLNRIADHRPDAVILRSELAACYLSSATILEGIGNLGDAREVRTLAMSELTRLLEKRPGDPALRLELAGCHGAMAEAAVLSGDITGAESLTREALKLLDGLLIEQPDHAEALSRKAAQLGLRAGIRRDRGMAAEAMADFEEGIRLLEGLRASSPGNQLVCYRLGLLWWQKGRMLGMAGKRNEEISLTAKARNLLADLETSPAAAGPRPEQLQRSVAYLLGDYGHALQLANRMPDAEKAFAEAITLWESLLRSRPQSEEYSEGLTWCRQRLDDLK